VYSVGSPVCDDGDGGGPDISRYLGLTEKLNHLIKHPVIFEDSILVYRPFQMSLNRMSEAAMVGLTGGGGKGIA
jgi:hypothetical protein